MPGRQVTALCLPAAGSVPGLDRFLRLASLARVALRSHLTQPQLSQHLADLPGEFLRQIGTRVLVRHSAQVDQQPCVSPPPV